MPTEPMRDTFMQDVLDGLAATPKTLPCKYLYDERGSQLFEAICEVDEYYVTRADIEVTERYAPDIAKLVGPNALLVELGSGSSTKTRALLDQFITPAAYVPIDISPELLHRSAVSLRQRYPTLEVLPLCADYHHHIQLPTVARPVGRSIIYFPGSTIGNFEPRQAVAFLRRLRAACAPNGAVLIGVDLKKAPQLLERAYDDGAGVTARFNLNLLVRINRELGANFNLEQFRHQAVYNQQLGRIEMHLVSLVEQRISLGDNHVTLAAGESIRSEESYKYSVDEFAAVSHQAGLEVQRVWLDERGYFSLQYLTPAQEGTNAITSA
ncbi:MAG TPA: L-histidine N(alpha)-methyltransferase [Sorangium sp.]|nr:L-histidine N(alpha)-methyltransferase [Sorangium sp.]